ncbi:SAV0927 family protein [Virgibacillus necropolis]|uniref:Cytoplasmic protein n=1 Tax=Virgibacillus necropolis TaxID=163877 RepID=A0A221MB54_9BACI|nr:SAV0927 family protein [Virgibacillus necropolis]ASN04873.1 cytoplasmic protein [Virgibacillus necropolis]
MTNKFKVLLDETVEKEVRYISFMGNFHRYDFAIMDGQEPNKKIIIDLRNNRFAAISKEDFSKEGEIEHSFHVTEMEGDELREFLGEIL